MLTFDQFTGINNVLPSHRLGDSELAEAVNVDIGRTGDITRRQGYTQQSALCHKNLHQGPGYLLATLDGGDLVAIQGGTTTTIYPALGPSRVWYCDLPDGRVTFSNGLINGITNGAGRTTWGVPIPEELGAFMDIAGQLHPGEYRYGLTYVRLADGRESGVLHSAPIQIQDGGLFLSGLQPRAGHAINVYLTSHNGMQLYLAGTTTNALFTFIGKNEDLALPCATEFLAPAPVGTFTAAWRDRVLVAVGRVLYASMPHNPELFDLRRDFKQFTAPITLIQPVESGVFVGTDTELAFLAGNDFDKLVYMRQIDGRTVPGSGVRVQGENIQRGQGTGQGDCMLCIAGGHIVAGYGDGGVLRLTDGRYTTNVAEVAATFRMVDGVPQYLAVPQ